MQAGELRIATSVNEKTGVGWVKVPTAGFVEN